MGSSVWIDFFADRPTPQVACLSGILDSGDDEIAITDVILTGILQGLRSDREVGRVDERLSVFEVLRLRDLADYRRAAALYRSARRKGVTVRRSSDCLIASICVREQVPLRHADADFDHLARLTELSVVPLDLVDALAGAYADRGAPPTKSEQPNERPRPSAKHNAGVANRLARSLGPDRAAVAATASRHRPAPMRLL